MFNPCPNLLCSVKGNPDLKAPNVLTATLVCLVVETRVNEQNRHIKLGQPNKLTAWIQP
jgi:hypothetical protein